MLIIALLTSCNNNRPTQEDYDKLQLELIKCKKTVEEMRNTPQILLASGQKFKSENDFINAKKEFNELIQKFPGTSEGKIAALLLADIEKIKKKQNEAEERKRTLGFKAIKESFSIKIGEVTLNFNSVKTGNQWIFNNYGNEYRYRSAERGDIYVLAKVSILADTKDPNLPPISVYKILNGNLTLIGIMGYEFVRWKDYGTYLGNYADYGNDFAHTKTISFSCGLSLSQTDIDNEPVFVVVKKDNCFYRSNNAYGNPPVSYKEGNCGMKSILKVNDFDKDYSLIKIFNKKKL